MLKKDNNKDNNEYIIIKLISMLIFDFFTKNKTFRRISIFAFIILFIIILFIISALFLILNPSNNSLIIILAGICWFFTYYITKQNELKQEKLKIKYKKDSKLIFNI